MTMFLIGQWGQFLATSSSRKTPFPVIPAKAGIQYLQVVKNIGEAIALTLAQYGAECILISRKIEGLDTVKQKIPAGAARSSMWPRRRGEPGSLASSYTTGALIPCDGGMLIEPRVSH